MPRTQRSPGTRTALDVLRGWFRPPAQDGVTRLLDEMDAGRLDARPVAISCFLRGTAGSLPRRWRYGTLTVDGHTLTWRRCNAFRRDTARLPPQLHVEQVRDVMGTERLQLKADVFQIIVCRVSAGRVELGVPTIDVPLVRRAIEADKQASNP